MKTENEVPNPESNQRFAPDPCIALNRPSSDALFNSYLSWQPIKLRVTLIVIKMRHKRYHPL
jgi:hypothetical protein